MLLIGEKYARLDIGRTKKKKKATVYRARMLMIKSEFKLNYIYRTSFKKERRLTSEQESEQYLILEGTTELWIVALHETLNLTNRCISVLQAPGSKRQSQERCRCLFEQDASFSTTATRLILSLIMHLLR